VKRIVVQPHTDDAYLSLHSHMVRWLKEGDEVQIVTYWSGKRGFEATDYAKMLGATHQFVFTDEHHPDYVEAPAGEGPPLHMKGHKIGDLNTITPGTEWYVPVGIQHQEHRTIAKLFRDSNVYSYLDTPYYAKTTRHREVNGLVAGMVMESFEAPSGRKYQDKWWKLFKTQSMFFHYNLEKIKGLPEIILRQYQ